MDLFRETHESLWATSEGEWLAKLDEIQKIVHGYRTESIKKTTDFMLCNTEDSLNLSESEKLELDTVFQNMINMA